MSVKRKRKNFGAPCAFIDRNVGDAKDGYIECTATEDKTFSLKRLELTKATQVICVISVNSVISINSFISVNSVISVNSFFSVNSVISIVSVISAEFLKEMYLYMHRTPHTDINAHIYFVALYATYTNMHMYVPTILYTCVMYQYTHLLTIYKFE